MAAKYILAVLGGLFLIAAAWRVSGGRTAAPQARAWLLVGAIFLGVSVTLFVSQ